MTRTIPDWAFEVFPEFDDMTKEGGLSVEAASAVLRANYSPVIGRFALETVARRMRDVRALTGEKPLEAINRERTEAGNRRAVPPPLSSTAFAPLAFPYQDSLVWCDIHIPYHLNRCMDASINSALKNGIRQIILAGDFIDCHWGSSFISWKTKGADVENIRQEFSISQSVFNILLEEFDSVVVIPGNHDGGRFQHMTNGSIDFELLCSFLGGYPVDQKPEKLTVGMNRWLTLKDSPWGDWRITHPQRARAIPLALAEVLAWKYDCNVLTAHQHFLGARMDRYGKHVVCDGGHMQNEKITDYKTETDNSHSNWTAGWVELIDGWPVTRAWRG